MMRALSVLLFRIYRLEDMMKGKTVFITGASSGIGEGCARKFASEGAHLILNARSVDKLETLKR